MCEYELSCLFSANLRVIYNLSKNFKLKKKIKILLIRNITKDSIDFILEVIFVIH